MVRLNRSRSLRAPTLWERGVSQVMLPNMVFGLWIVLGLSKWANDPFGRFRTKEKKVIIFFIDYHNEAFNAYIDLCILIIRIVHPNILNIIP